MYAEAVPPSLNVCSFPSTQSEPIRELCYDLGVEDVTLLSGGEINATTNYLVFLNGLIVGYEATELCFFPTLGYRV